METSAVLRGVRLSPQKGRLVADQIRGMSVDKALDLLNFSPKNGRRSLRRFWNQQSLMPNITMVLILTN